MFHLLAWKNTAGSASTIDMTPVPDGIVTVQNGHFIPSINGEVIAAYASGAHIGRARLNSPTIRQTNPSYIRPINVALLPPNDPPIASYVRAPLAIKGAEELIGELQQSANTAEDSFMLAWVQFGNDPAPLGVPYTCRFTATGTAVAGAWTQLQVTLEQGLPVGEYALIWSECFSTTGVAHRWTFQNQFYRPGHLSFANNGLRSYRELYQAMFGVMGKFVTYALPTLEVLCDAADTTYEGYATVVRVGDVQLR